MNKPVGNITVGEDLNAVIRVNPGKGPDRELVRAGFYAHIRQATPRHFPRLPISDSVMIVARSGRKEASAGSIRASAGPGEIVGIAGGEAIDLINYGPDAGGPYEADAFGFDDDLVREVAATLPDTCRRAGLFAFRPPLIIEESIAAAREALDPARAVPAEIARHRMRELLVWLAREGVFFATRREPTVATRVRDLVRTDCARGWSSGEIAGTLGMSEATLRRRLRETGQSVTAMIADARMASALGILQTSAMSIDRVALEVGYASASKFAARFRARFGLSPSEIRTFRS
jgi:AraC-like DNA-binding protein